jgi:hypothetical protein
MSTIHENDFSNVGTNLPRDILIDIWVIVKKICQYASILSMIKV